MRINRNKASFVLPSINTPRSSFTIFYFLKTKRKLVFEIKAVVSGRINTLLAQFLAYCKDGTIEQDFNRYDDDILWSYGDDWNDVVTKYINYLTGEKTGYRDLLRYIFDLCQCDVSIIKLEEINWFSSTFICCSEQHSDFMYGLAYEIEGELNCFYDVSDISFTE